MQATDAKTVDLQRRFERFIASMPGYENVDELLRGIHLKNKKRADYLLWDRRVIVEQKVLMEDPWHKAQKFINDLLKKRGLLLYGTTSTDRIFASMPDGQEQKRRMLREITKGIESSFAAADKQTRDTREVFAIPNAIGIVVLLNPLAPTLYPDLVRYGISEVSQKTNDNGLIRYPQNDGLIMISEAHTDTTNGQRGAPCYTSPTPHARDEKMVREFADSLVQSWGTFNGALVIRQEVFKV